MPFALSALATPLANPALATLANSGIARTAIGFVILCGLFWAIESIWPEDRSQPKWRRGSLTDTAYFFILIPIAKFLSTVAIIIAFVLTVRFIPKLGVAQLGSQPQWLQVLEVILLGDIFGYWIHRAFHRVPALWPYHAVHHSSEQIDWLASVRVHPVNSVVTKLGSTVPFFFLGFSKLTLGAYIGFLAIYPLVLHANVAWSYGPFRTLIASPAYHRWHHTAEREGLNKNLSGLFPFIDVLFGTYYFPRRASSVYGLYRERMSTNIFTQLAYPFRRRKHPASRHTTPVPPPTASQWPG